MLLFPPVQGEVGFCCGCHTRAEAAPAVSSMEKLAKVNCLGNLRNNS